MKEAAHPGKLAKFANASISNIQELRKKATSSATALVHKVKSGKSKMEAENVLISYDEKIEILRKLKQLVDDGILSQEEFEAKKKEILGL